MLVRDFLEQSARLTPDKVALIFENERLTYSQIDTMASRLANALIDNGVQRGDRVGVFLGNSVEAVVSVFAILKANAVFVVINVNTKADKLAFVLNNCRATALISHVRLRDVVAEACPSVSSLHYLVLAGSAKQTHPSADIPTTGWDAALEAYPADQPPRRCIDMDLAALIYTSGSTGVSKGVMVTHLNMVSAATSVVAYLENTSQDILLNALPLSFSYGLYQVLTAFMVGGTLVLERGFVFPQAVLDRMAGERVTGFAGVPTVFALILQQKHLDRLAFPHLRYITNAAAALPVDHIRRLREIFPHAAIYSMYGLTECKRATYLPPDELDRRPDSVGIAIPNTEVWIENEDGQRLGPNTVGELIVRGAHVARGYWENPEETARMFRPGPIPGETVLHTGDLFRMDQEGFLYFVSRKDDIIKTRGEKVSPKEVENVLCALPGVMEVAVVGLPDPMLGEAIHAFVVPEDGQILAEQEVILHCRRHLEDFMIPAHIEFRSELPKTESGKIRRASLR